MFEWADFWDLWKPASVGLAGLFGIMGLLTSFKDEAGKITVWGKINLAGILFSTTMGVLSQIADARQQAAAAEESAAQAQASAQLAQSTAGLAQTSATKAGDAAANTERLIGDLVGISRETRAIATGTERSVDNSRSAARAGQQAASATLGVARDTALAVSASQAGLVRIERLVSPFEKPTILLFVRRLKTREDHPDCPKENASARAEVDIGRTATQNSDFDITYKGTGAIETVPNRASICRFTLTYPLEVQSNASGLTSYLDLPGKTIYFGLYGAQISKIGKEDLDELRIQTPDGQYIVVPGEMTQDWDRNGFLSMVAFRYTFPASRDPRAGAER